MALITGAAGGIGRAAAVRFAAEGARVGLVDVSRDGLRESLAAVEKAGGTGLTVEADVTRSADVARYAAAVAERFGGIDYFFNNAGILARCAPWWTIRRTSSTGCSRSTSRASGSASRRWRHCSARGAAASSSTPRPSRACAARATWWPTPPASTRWSASPAAPRSSWRRPHPGQRGLSEPDRHRHGAAARGGGQSREPGRLPRSDGGPDPDEAVRHAGGGRRRWSSSSAAPMRCYITGAIYPVDGGSMA